MTDTSLHFEIREVPDPEGGLRFELVVEGTRTARARASHDVLHDMHVMLGLRREEVANELREALRAVLTSQLEKVSVSEPTEDPDHPLKFRSRYTYRDFDDVSTGVVWYDVPAGTTGPELPAIVRNKMRHEVHRKLTRDGSEARALVDLHR
jgi:hypothetical protein